jgi:DNA-directed RNA polymerase specialized sigma24 family protein
MFQALSSKTSMNRRATTEQAIFRQSFQKIAEIFGKNKGKVKKHCGKLLRAVERLILR